LRCLTRLALCGYALCERELAPQLPGWDASRALALSLRTARLPTARRHTHPQTSTVKKQEPPRSSGAKRTHEHAAPAREVEEPKRARAAARAAPPVSVPHVPAQVAPRDLDASPAVVLAVLQRLARMPLRPGAAKSAGTDAVAVTLRCRAAASAAALAACTQAEAADVPAPVDGEGVPAELDASERVEERAIRQLSVQDAALRTLRLAEQPSIPSAAAYIRKPGAPASRETKHASDRKPRKAGGAARRGAASDGSASDDDDAHEMDVYASRLRAAVRRFQGADGSALFGQSLLRHYGKRGIEARLLSHTCFACFVSDALSNPARCPVAPTTRRAQLSAPPTFLETELDLFKLFMEVSALGGCAAVSDRREWKRVVRLLLGAEDVPSGAAAELRKKYDKLLLSYEERCVDKAAPPPKCVFAAWRVGCAGAYCAPRARCSTRRQAASARGAAKRADKAPKHAPPSRKAPPARQDRHACVHTRRATRRLLC
jgi:hypothetical protein